MIGAHDRFAGRRLVRLAAGGADAHRYSRLFLATEAQLFDAAADAFGEKQQLVVASGARDQHAKLFAAEPRTERRATNCLLQERSDLDQHLVARFVAERVVDAFEVVEVEHQRRGRRRLRLEHLFEGAAVGQTRERVLARLDGLELGAPSLGERLLACDRGALVFAEQSPAGRCLADHQQHDHQRQGGVGPPGHHGQNAERAFL